MFKEARQVSFTSPCTPKVSLYSSFSMDLRSELFSNSRKEVRFDNADVSTSRVRSNCAVCVGFFVKLRGECIDCLYGRSFRHNLINGLYIVITNQIRCCAGSINCCWFCLISQFICILRMQGEVQLKLTKANKGSQT